MAYLAVDKRGYEIIFLEKPERNGDLWFDDVEIEIEHEYGSYSSDIYLPKGSIKKLIGRELAWDDEPVEI